MRLIIKIKQVLQKVYMRTKKAVTKPSVEIGAYYILDNGDNPFKRKCVVRVRVKDVKDGYVLYAMAPFTGGMFQNESMKVSTFLAIYKINKENSSEKESNKLP